MPTPIYVIGSSNTDMVVKTKNLPRPGETILGGQFLMNAGGKGANQAVAAARLGGQVSFIANVGNDLFGQQALQQFKNEKINTQFITADSKYPSGVALINVDAKGENCIAVAPGANGNLTPDRLQNFFCHLTTPAFVLIQFEIPIETVEYVIEQCSLKNIPVILNPAPANKIKTELWKNVFLITPNESETEYLTGIKVLDDDSVRNAAHALHGLGIQIVIITLGSKGAFWSAQNQNGFIKTTKVSAIDTTAAGDCFNGALTVAIAEGIPLAKAAEFACRAATISVTRMGAQASMPYRKELN